jgi:hypothetical protein
LSIFISKENLGIGKKKGYNLKEFLKIEVIINFDLPHNKKIYIFFIGMIRIQNALSIKYLINQ